MPFKCFLAVLPQDFVGWLFADGGWSGPHNEPRTLLFPVNRVHRHHAGWRNKVNYVACFHIYNIASVCSPVNHKVVKHL